MRARPATGGRSRPALGALAASACALLLGTQGVSAAAGAPDDPWYVTGQQWGLTQAGFPAAWCASTGAGALIAVIDGGIDFSHPDLAGKDAGSLVVRNGRVVPGEAGGDHGHATHVAGIAAADTGNGLGMAGAAPGARLLSVQVLFGAAGAGTSADLATAIRYVADQVAPTWHGPVVLNISVGAAVDTTPPEVAAAIAHASSRGLGVALAAGDHPGGSGYAAMDEQALVVGALDESGAVASYSPTTGVNVLAAGGGTVDGTNVATGIVSTFDGGRYAWLTGTSMAAPLAAAALALLMSTGLTNQQADQRIESAEVHGALRVDRALGRTAGCRATTLPVTATAPSARPGTAAATAPVSPSPALPDIAAGVHAATQVPGHTTAAAPPPASTAGRSVRAGLAVTTGHATAAGLVAAAALAGAGVGVLARWRRRRRSGPATG
jgi:serine protease